MRKVEENGIRTPTQKLFELATAKSPNALMMDFLTNASPEVLKAMQSYVASLFGALPSIGATAETTTTGDKLGTLLLQLQMTGYLLRNAEYVMAIRSVLQLKTRSISEYRAQPSLASLIPF